MYYEDYKPFPMVSVFGRQPGQLVGITSVYDAAKFILEQWPPEAGGPKHRLAQEILLKCLEGGCSAQVARVAFVEAAREANIFMETPTRPPGTGKVERWGKRKPVRRS